MKSSRIFFYTRFKYFIWTSRVPNYLYDFFWILWDFHDIFLGIKKVYLEFSRFILTLRLHSRQMKSFLVFSWTRFSNPSWPLSFFRSKLQTNIHLPQFVSTKPPCFRFLGFIWPPLGLSLFIFLAVTWILSIDPNQCWLSHCAL